MRNTAMMTTRLGPWLVVLVAALTGCQSTTLDESGFLTDYSKLKPDEPGQRLIYVDTVSLPDLEGLVVAPVSWRFYDAEVAALVPPEARARGTRMLQQGLEQKLSKYVSTLSIIHSPLHHWALRCAITDFGRSLESKDSGGVFGDLTIEAEIIDISTHQQLFALVKNMPGVELPPDEAGWQRFANRIDEWGDNLLAALGN